MWFDRQCFKYLGPVRIVSGLSMQPTGTLNLIIYKNALSTCHQSLRKLDCNSIVMEFFRKLLSAIGATSCERKKVDFISNLPLEVAQHLLRMLDSRSLLNAAIVSRRWLTACQADFRLRQSARRHLRKQRCQLLQSSDQHLRSRKRRYDSYTSGQHVILKGRPTNFATQNSRRYHVASIAQSRSKTSVSKNSLRCVRNNGSIRSICKIR